MAEQVADDTSEASVEEVLSFLRSRNVEEHVIEKFRTENMDCLAVDCSPEIVLEEMGLTKKGDIYGLKAMCSQKRKAQNSGEEDRKKRKLQLVQEVLKERQQKKKKRMSTSSSTINTSCADEETSPKTKTRRISLGMMQFNDNRNKLVSVRYSKGGGSRTLDVPYTMTKQELIEQSKLLFFPDGVSPIGRLTDFTFDLANFKGEIIANVKDSDEVEVPFTVQGYFESFKLTRVQIYLTCHRIEPSSSSSHTSTTTEQKGKTWRQNLHQHLENERKLWKNCKAEEDERKEKLLSKEMAQVTNLEELRSAREIRVPKEPESGTPRALMIVQHPLQGRVTRHFSTKEKMVAVYDWVGSLDLFPQHFKLQVQPSSPISPDEAVSAYEGVVIYIKPVQEPLLMSTTSPEISFKGFADSVEIEDDFKCVEHCHSPSLLDFDPVFEIIPHQIMELDEARPTVSSQQPSCSMNDSSAAMQGNSSEQDNIHISPQENFVQDDSDGFCYVHRSRLKDDVIAIFKNQDSLSRVSSFRVIDESGKLEEGVGIGVTKDVIATFWQQILTATAIGDREKVPCIRHDFQKSEWMAIGRVLVFGFKKIEYFPLGLSKTFLASCLFGEESIDDEYLLSSFRYYITGEERETFDKIRQGNFESNDDDILDFLGNYKTYRRVSKDNINGILSELAHQELIQRPRYIAQCWAPVLSDLKGYVEFSSPGLLAEFFALKMPTAKKTVKVIDCRPENEAEIQSLDYLKKFIRSLDAAALATFLKFTTGSDVMPQRLEVSFTSMDGLTRRPIAHTCGPLLELPTTYRSYSELAEEFTSVLREKGAWSFNIV